MPRSGSDMVYVSVCLNNGEKRRLDAAVREAGINRNAFIRHWIAGLPDPEE